ncbi:MAG TPA: histidine kinase [Luteolibacter sp.]|nr:histidine kinase [Luteolibacter sp.]
MTGSVKRLHAKTVATLIFFSGAAVSGAFTPVFAQTFNPISQVARILNPRLADTETRVRELESKLSTLPSYREKALKTGLGCRAGRFTNNDPDPSFVIDLGSEYPVDSVYLIPAQRDSAGDPNLFPKLFTIEVSNREDFGQRMVTYTAGANIYPSGDGKPARFVAHGTPARYVRLTVHKGEQLSAGEIFALSEMIVISKGDPVSFGATVKVEGMLDVPGQWGAQYLTDGRTPLGIWQGGEWTSAPKGDVLSVSTADPKVSWSLDLGSNAPVERVILFPQLIPQTSDCTILPDELSFILETDGAAPQVIEWKNPLPGTPMTTPVVIPFQGKTGSRLKLDSTAPWAMGSLKFHALSEIEVWSNGTNIAIGRNVVRTHSGKNTDIAVLTDGRAVERQILPIGNWLIQLQERSRLESDLAWHKPLLRDMVSESELNATWGSAVLLGLTFLIPVFIVERRRLINRNHLETLRKRIASDLHDDIGSNLGSISLIARTARKDLIKQHGPEEVAEDLGQVESIARESSLAMRDIVWLLERRADTIGDLIQRMRDTANRLLRDVEYTLESDSCKTASKLSLDAKRHLFLFYKETIHNVFKHSKATRVSVRLWDKDDKLVLEICDNGIGFDANSTTRPTSVHKLEERGRVLEGQVDILSIPTKGTSVRLTVKRSHLIVHTSLS